MNYSERVAVLDSITNSIYTLMGLVGDDDSMQSLLGYALIEMGEARKLATSRQNTEET